MTLSDIRTRLSGLKGRAYWRSLEELADTPEFREYMHREFPANASEFTDPAGRREFLKLMGASLALAGVSACTRQPEEKIVPYVRQPEVVVPGRPLFFATAMPAGGYAMPVLAENHMGRPTKIEGNPEHPASLGATDIFGQASVLSLYDPDRSRNIIGRSAVKTWEALTLALQGAVTAQRAIKGQGLRILSEPITSPSLTDQIQTLLAGLPDAKWHQWDPVYGTVQGGAPAAMPVYRFDKADVVVSLDADFLGFGAGMLRYSKDFSSRRRIATPQDEMNRLYVVEPVPTITGGKADHRLAIKAAEVHAFAASLAGLVGVAGAGGGGQVPGANGAKFASAVAADLHAHHGRSVVVAGDRQPAAVHALARQMNEALGNVGSTVVYTQPIASSPADGTASMVELVGAMDAGKVDVLLILGSNPVFTTPADLDFAAALKKVGTAVHVGLYYDETAFQCQWHVPEAHYLESWGDARSFDGTVSLMQPLIAPLYDARQAIEVIAALNGQPGVRAAALVKDYWTRAFQGKTTTTWTLRDREGKSFASVDQFWRHALHDGFITGTAVLDWEKGTLSGPQAGSAGVAAAPPAAGSGYEVVFRPDPTILDGRHANNGWLQELPKPFSKVTWDNVAYVSPNTATKLGIKFKKEGRSGNQGQDILEIKYKGRATKLPVWILPGTADDVVVVHFGYGRERGGRIGNAIGHNTFGIRTAAAPWFDSGAEITTTGDKYLIVSTQNHFVMEDRYAVRQTSVEEYRANPGVIAAIAHGGAEHEEAKAGEAAHTGPEKRPGGVSKNAPKVWSLYNDDEFKYNGNKWGMTIDLNACTGCNACVTACQAENNTAVVGKTQVDKNREMHWIRVDTYFEGDAANPDGFHQQPVPCMQCENAPCEVVCPVAATQHNDEGLNDMVYNRCVGTRYCSNNCPYKVRRFNFLLYSDFTTPELWAQRNPDVTIRSRGVMEKCTYCVQRISHARIDAKTEGRAIKDGDVVTACQQVCPADAIVFGDLNDPNSKVSKLVAQDRNYGLLEELNTRPRTTYLAVVKNPNKVLG